MSNAPLHNPRMHLTQRDRGTYRSQCKLCPAGVYTGQPAVWLRNPAGLSHQECAERAEREAS